MKTLVLIRDRMGRYDKYRSLYVDYNDTIDDLMLRISAMSESDLPPIMMRLRFRDKNYFYDTPGTLAENKLVPSHPRFIDAGWSLECSHRFARLALGRLGIPCCDEILDVRLCGGEGGACNGVEAEEEEDEEEADGDAARGKMMRIAVRDVIVHTGREMRLRVRARDTVASLMEKVQRRWRYPVAMQELHFGREVMGNPDATLADYHVWEGSEVRVIVSRQYQIDLDRQVRKERNELSPDDRK